MAENTLKDLDLADLDYEIAGAIQEYTQSKMRDHYNNCVKNKIFEEFPHTSLKRKHINNKIHEYNVKKDKWES
jgi:hypothetical protein